MNFNKNNLDQATSPYLQQHKDNPIYWQEWSSAVRDYAQENDKILFFSVGYSTCHWCHVMAHEAFENKEITDFLNKHFVSVKVDREERPDIDQYLMAYCYQTRGGGGWPLNVFLTPDLNPFFVVTYVGVKSEHGTPAFIDLLDQAKKYYDENKDDIVDYMPPAPEATVIRQMDLIQQLAAKCDLVYGGFGTGQKFPPHTTLLYLLHYYENTQDPGAKQVLEKTLDMMAMRGLHDHLEGGFFRYCVDRAWTIPHFEKMLYDQAMLLWIYSAAYKVIKKEVYKTIAQKIITCLNDSFKHEGLYIAGFDADTDGIEGKTYLWEKEEIENALSRDEFAEFSQLYEITDKGNMEGKNHLIKTELKFLPAIEQKLLALRKKRTQPFADKKIITSWNALLGVAFVNAYRCLNNADALKKAKRIFAQLLEKQRYKNLIVHSSINGSLQKQSFLEDYASLLVLASYLAEESKDYEHDLKMLYEKTKSYYESGLWYEIRDTDFKPLPAQLFDHPMPSSVSLAKYGILRADILSRKEFMPGHYKQPASYDFYNLVTFIEHGHFHIIETSEKISWNYLPINSMQRKGQKFQDCFERVCKEFATAQELIQFFQSKV